MALLAVWTRAWRGISKLTYARLLRILMTVTVRAADTSANLRSCRVSRSLIGAALAVTASIVPQCAGLQRNPPVPADCRTC